MARIVLTTVGSYGDLFPYLAIAECLRARGHEPVIAAPATYRLAVERTGAVFAAVRPDIDYEDAHTFRRVMDPKRGAEVVVREMLVPHLRASYSDLEAACDGADLLVSHVLTYAGPILGEKRGLPWLSTVLAPMVFCSAYEPPALAPIPWFARLRPLGPAVVGFLWGLMRKISWSWSEPIRALRSELGLPAEADPLWEGQHSPHGVLALFSRAFGEPQPDWPAHTTVCGFPFHDHDFGGGEDGDGERLQEFLGAGPAPIVFSLGSSAVQVAGSLYEVAAQAAGRLGRRAVLVTGGAPCPAQLPDGVIAIRSAEVFPLFEAASVIVHAGGVGTTGQAMRAGRPQLVIPFAHDQFDNALRVEQRGLGRVLHRKRLTAAPLALELDAVLSDSSMLERAALAAETVRAERGADAACDAIEGRLAGT